MMAGARFGIVGLIFFAIGRSSPTRRQWRNAAVAGALLFLGGNGLLTWAEQRVLSGASALLVATSPLWIVLLAWFARARRPTPRLWLALTLGALAVALLTLTGPDRLDSLGALALLASALSWALGTVVVRRADLPESALTATGAEMLTGSAALLAVSVTTGELSHFALTAVSRTDLAAFIYLIVVSSLAGYATHAYLAARTTPQRLATYAFVTPLIAVILGALVAHEPVSPRTIAATIAMVSAVALLSRHHA
jgi:drug/metabolite transporter (DMT)-like permease